MYYWLMGSCGGTVPPVSPSFICTQNFVNCDAFYLNNVLLVDRQLRRRSTAGLAVVHLHT